MRNLRLMCRIRHPEHIKWEHLVDGKWKYSCELCNKGRVVYSQKKE